jgi:hypothetical protein
MIDFGIGKGGEVKKTSPLSVPIYHARSFPSSLEASGLLAKNIKETTKSIQSQLSQKRQLGRLGSLGRVFCAPLF